MEYTPAQLVKARRWARRKIEADVNAARWRNFFNNRNPRKAAPGYGGISEGPSHFGGRHFWQGLKSSLHGGARRFRWMFLPSPCTVDGEKLLPEWSEGVCSLNLIHSFRPPGKWKAKRNDRVRLVCDASAFIACLQRALVARIL
jgi:hypothetical protein